MNLTPKAIIPCYGTRASLARKLDTFGVTSSWWTTFAIAFGVLFLHMAPIRWIDNEINYIDLALQFVVPERFAATSAVFDDSAARFLSFGLLGLLAEIAGRDAAMIIGRIAIILAYAAALATLARAWRLSPAEVTLGLVVFLLVGQSYFAGHTLFRGVEPNGLAYPCAIFAVAWAWRGAGGRAIGAVALATYFHFLVGGFWAVAALLLLAIQGTPLPRVARLGAVYAGVVAPLVLILVYQWLVAPAPDLAGLDRTLMEIYAVFRAPHHVAPFVSPASFGNWIPGIGTMIAASFLLGLASAIEGPRRHLAIWILVLHSYLALCFVLAFLDRGTHALAPLYMFRPNPLILLMTLLLLISWLREELPARGGRGLAVLALAALIAYIPPKLAPIAYHVAQARPIPWTPQFEAAAPEAIIHWFRKNAASDAVVVIEPTNATDWDAAWIAFERRIERPTLVNFKFVPTAPQDLARWYRLIRWREAVFAGSCELLEEQPVDYLVVVQPSTLERMSRCGRVVWHRDGYGIVVVKEAPRAGPETTPVAVD